MAGAALKLDEIEAKNFEIVDDISDELVAILDAGAAEYWKNGDTWPSAEEVFTQLRKKHGYGI